MLNRILAAAATASGIALFAAAAHAQAPAAPAAPTAIFAVTSPAIKDGMLIDKKYAGPNLPNMACGGDNISPPLQWSGAPANTKSFAVLVFDFEGGRGPGVSHWVSYGIAPEATGIPEGAGNKENAALRSGANMRGATEYFGPCAPATDSPHHYIYSVYALDVPKEELPVGLKRDEFMEKVKGRIINIVSIVTSYKRP